MTEELKVLAEITFKVDKRERIVTESLHTDISEAIEDSIGYPDWLESVTTKVKETEWIEIEEGIPLESTITLNAQTKNQISAVILIRSIETMNAAKHSTKDEAKTHFVSLMVEGGFETEEAINLFDVIVDISKD